MSKGEALQDSVTVAYVHPGTNVAHSWHDSYKNMLFFDMSQHGRIMRGGEIKMRCGTEGLPSARNMAVEGFLDDRSVDWLFFIDTDMGFEPDSLERLLEAADPESRPIMGGLCFAQKEIAMDGYSGFACRARATILDWIEHDGGRQFAGRAWWPSHTVTRCAGTGAAFLLVHRTVLEKMRDRFGTWFDRVPGSDGKLLGEDVSFCVRAGVLDIPIHVHTGVKTTHMKTVWLGEDEFWRQQQAPPAEERTAVIVPVMKRPQNAEPFMRSLVASTGLASVYALCNTTDHESIKAWVRAGATVIEVTGTGTFAEKVNEGFRNTHEPWLFLVGDDVRFHPGWLDAAQHIAKLAKADVVGTNDLGNPRVIAGEHAVHVLMRRSYIAQQGGSWDGPGVVCHEGYRHWFVDDEIVTAAKQRGVWAMALASRVEHLHPLFGKAESDDIYELGQSASKQDERLFRGRLKAFA